MRQDFLNAEELVNRLNKAFTEHSTIIDKNAKAMRNLASEYSKLPSDYLKAQREIQATMQEQAKTEQALLKTAQEKQKLIQQEIATTMKLNAAKKTEIDTNEAIRKSNDAKAAADAKAAQKSIADSEKAIAQKEKEFASFEREFNRYEADLKRKEIAEQKAALSSQKAKEKERLDEIKLQQTREKAFDKYEAGLNKQVESQKDAYGQMSAELNKSFRASASLAVEMYKLKEAGQQASPEYQKLNEQFIRTREETLKLDAALKSIDSDLGRNQRNVGNYKYDALNNSIQQILRETPSAAVSLNTFFLAISNNLPQFFEEFTKVRTEISALKKAAEDAAANLSIQSEAQSAVSAAAQETEEALSTQVESIISSIGASQEQALAIKEQIAAHVGEIETTGAATSTTVANTESVLVNAGANVDQTATIQAGIVASAEATAARNTATASLTAQTLATVEANAALAAQPTMWQRISQSLFSLNTLMTAGVLVLTLYGGKIIDYVGNLFKAESANKALSESIETLNNIQIESTKAIIEEGIELEKNLAVAADTTLSYKEREIAAQQVLDQYPYWFENLGKEAILNGKVEEAVKGVNEALLARAKAAAATTKLTENQTKIIDFEEEILKIQEKIISAEERVRVARIQARAASSAESGNDAEINALKDIEDYNNDIANIKKEINSLDEINNRLLGYSIENRKKSIGLDYNSEEAKNNELRIEELKDFEATRFQLIQLRLENEAAMNERTFMDETLNYERREQAAQKYHEIQRQIAENALAEQLRILQKERDAEIASIEARIKEQEITEKNGRAVIYSIRKKYDNDYLIAYENYAEGLRKIDLSIAESLRGVYDKINFQKAQNLIDERDLRNTETYVGQLQEIVNKNKDYREIEKANKQFQEGNRSITMANAQKEIDDIESKLRGLKDVEANVQKRGELENELFKAKKRYSEAEKEQTDEQIAAINKLQRATESYLNSFKTSFFSNAGLESLNMFTTIEENGKTTFANLMAGANTTSEKFGVAFNSITSVAKDAYAFLNQNSQAYFDNQYNRLDHEKELALKYAGENTAGQEEINRQFEEQKRQIRIKEAKAQKEQALFNAVISTAQAVVAALPNIPLSIIIGALGAAQIAFIAGQQIPAYYKGTDNHPGGLMMVNDAKGSNYKEVIETPGGQLYKPEGRNVLMNAPKGTVVHKSRKAFEDNFNALLAENNISPFAATMFRSSVSGNRESGLSKNDMREVMRDAMAELGEKKTLHVNINETGFNSYWRSNGGIKRDRDNRRQIKG